MLKNLQQPLELDSVLWERFPEGNESPQIRNMTFDFVHAALSLLQPSFGAIPLHTEEQ